MAAERIGLDPLVSSYRSLGIEQHGMTYVDAPAERIPFGDAHFDVVTVFNSLDHVDNHREAVREIVRVLRPGGLLLLIVEVDHPPTPTEPIRFPANISSTLSSDLELVEERRFEIGNHDIYGQIRIDDRFNETDARERPSIVTAKLIRRPTNAAR